MSSSTRRFLVPVSAGALSLLAAGLVASGGATTAKTRTRAGTLRVVVTADPGTIEPALASSFSGFEVMNATQLGLVSFLDKGRGAGRRLVPAGAAALPRISRDGRTYVFQIRRGLRFSDRTPVAARNFVAGFERVLDPRMHVFASPIYFDDIKGARAFRAGRATHISGLVAKKNRLVVHLTRPAPDFVERLALPFVGALPLDLPVVPGGVGAPLPSAGPYYVSEYVPGRMGRLLRNPYWNRAALPWRPANVDEIDYLGRTLPEAVAAVARGHADVVTFIGGTLAPERVRELIRLYGVNRGRLFVRPMLARSEIVFNFRRPLFGRHANLRRAVSFAINRTQLTHAHGPLAGRPTDQLIPMGRSGFHDWKLFPNRPNLTAAKRLARGALQHRVVSLYVPDTIWGPAEGAVIRSNLARLGASVRVETVAAAGFFYRLNRPREPWDLAVAAWAQPRVDPSAFVNESLDSGYIGKPSPNGFNFGRFNAPKWDVRMRNVSSAIRGRERAFALLDRDLMRKATPVAPYLVANALTLVSGRVGCFNSLNSGWPNLAALCLKVSR